MAPKNNWNDAGLLDTPERIHSVQPLSEKIEGLNLIEKEKQLYAEIAKLCGECEKEKGNLG